MATKKFYHDIDLGTTSQIAGARIENVTSTELTTLAGSLGAANRGYIVYNTTDGALYTWGGSSFSSMAVSVSGDVVFTGIINPTSSSTVVPKAGAQYVVDAAGTLSNQGGAITYSPSANVEVGDVVLFTSATTASVMERNLEAATETTLGTIRLSSAAEVAAGVVTDEAVTPFTLHSYVNPELADLQSQITSNDADIATNAAAIVSEAGTRSTADGVLQANIDAEEARALAAEAVNAGLISDEETRALAAEAVLQGNIDSEAIARAADVDAEEARALAAEGVLQTNITSEESARIAADSTLQSNIDTEAAARAAADTTLQSNIDAEAASRAAADTTLQGNIDTEEAARIAADSALDTRVTAVEARDEVFTYTASVDLTADTAFTVTHSLGLVSKDAFVINTMHAGQQVSLQVASVDANSLTLTSAVGLTGVVVTVIGM